MEQTPVRTDHLQDAIDALDRYIAEETQTYGDGDPFGTAAFAHDAKRRIESLRTAIADGEI